MNDGLIALLDRAVQAHPLVGEISEESRERLRRFTLLVASWGERIQLTSRPSALEVMLHRVLDALFLAVHLPSWETLSDIGSGAGFPGIPLACVFPDREITLIESRERRHHFLRHATRELRLTGVQCLLGRAEKLQPKLSSLVLAQAVAPPDKALLFCLPWVAPGGWIGIPLSQRQTAPRAKEGQFSEERISYYEAFDGRKRAVWLAQLPR